MICTVLAAKTVSLSTLTRALGVSMPSAGWSRSYEDNDPVCVRGTGRAHAEMSGSREQKESTKQTLHVGVRGGRPRPKAPSGSPPVPGTRRQTYRALLCSRVAPMCPNRVLSRGENDSLQSSKRSP